MLWSLYYFKTIIILWHVLFFFMCQHEVYCYSYQYGDKVTLLLQTTTTVKKSPSSSTTNNNNVDTLRRHMPIFGYDTTTKMNLLEFTTDSNDKKSFIDEVEYVSFSVGSRHLPLIHVRDEQGNTLKEVIFKITYTDNNKNNNNDMSGEILSVTTDSKYKDKNDKDDDDHDRLLFTFLYTWIEKPDLDERGGIIFITIITVILFISSFLRACNESEIVHNDDESYFCEDEKYLTDQKGLKQKEK